jgi:signal transduction histidine kinase
VEDLYVSLYEHVSCGVVRVEDGVVRYANPASLPYASKGVGHRLDSPLLNEVTKAAGRGLLSLPYRLELATPAAVHAIITAAPWHSREILVVFRLPDEAGGRDEARLAEFITSVAVDTCAPMECLLVGLTAQVPAPTLERQRLASHAIALHRQLQKVRDLATLLSRSAAARPEGRTHERLLLGALLERAVKDASSLASSRQVVIRIRCPDGTSPAIYGSQTWLFKAIAEFLEHIVFSTAPGNTVEVSLAAVGAQALIRARVTATGAQGFEPLDRISIGLALSRHIAREHGGSVRIENEFDAVDVVMELPVGAPAGDNALLSVEQASRFERSVSELRAYSQSRHATPRRPRTETTSIHDSSRGSKT